MPPDDRPFGYNSLGRCAPRRRGLVAIVTNYSSDKFLREQNHLAPEIPSFEKCIQCGSKLQSITFWQWTKVHKITSTRSGVSAVFYALFQVTISCSIPKIFAINSGSCSKSVPRFHVFEPQILRKGAPKYLTQFLTLHSLPDTRQSLVAVG